jgi:hypothetical protein
MKAKEINTARIGILPLLRMQFLLGLLLPSFARSEIEY